jgi:hypothetical protein
MEGREQVDATHVRCAACGAVFFRRDLDTIEHGTYDGYCKHKRERFGDWDWPACDPCKDALREYTREYGGRDHAISSRRRRSSARFAAHARIARLYPGLYHRLYVEELDKRSLAPVLPPQVPLWDDMLARLVKEALGADEDSVNDRLLLPGASHREREVMRQVRRLRLVLEQLTSAEAQ